MKKHAHEILGLSDVEFVRSVGYLKDKGIIKEVDGEWVVVEEKALAEAKEAKEAKKK